MPGPVASGTHCTFTVSHFPLYFRCFPRDKWVPDSPAWRVLRLRMAERPPIWRVAANIVNKQSWTAEKGWSSRWGAKNSSP